MDTGKRSKAVLGGSRNNRTCSKMANEDCGMKNRDCATTKPSSEIIAKNAESAETMTKQTNYMESAPHIKLKVLH